MLNGTFDRQGEIADFTLPTGCPLCGGELAVRLTPGTSYSYCAHCHWLSRSHVAVGPNSVRVEHPPGGNG
jgi:hypothetical protein